MKTILFINLLIGYITLSAVLLIGLSVIILKHFPTSKVSGFVRRYLITDQDLEPIEGDESQSPSEGTNS
jgi:hypothetical protein